MRSDGLTYTVRFSRTRTGEVVGDRAFNAQAIGAALLGDTLQAVANDPANPNRQIATFKTPSGPAFSLESTVVGRRQEPPVRPALKPMNWRCRCCTALGILG